MGKRFVLAVVLARAGSKRVKGKNLRDLGGKPMVCWTCEAAMRSGKIDKAIVSTDSEEIKIVSSELGIGVPFMRPKALAGDAVSSFEALKHAVNEFEKRDGREVDIVVLLQPSSPFRTARHIDGAIGLFLKSKASSLFSVTSPAKDSKFLARIEDGKLRFVGKSEKLAGIFNLNGAIYIYDRETLFSGEDYPVGKKPVFFEMPIENSLDIDTEQDFEKAKKIAKKSRI